jgi:thermolysin
MRSLVNPVRQEAFFEQFPNYPDFFLNAGWYSGAKVMVYGAGAPIPLGGRVWRPFSASLDIVGHELTHGVTQFSSGLIYFDESGALNEAFSDIMGTSIEFFQMPNGNYLIGEAAITGGIRSMQDPHAFGDPDHYSLRFQGSEDNGGVHTNSSIVNHAFYLAIEGGRNRVSGLQVAGVGGANREQIEKIFYRAFVSMLTPGAGFSDARAATIQSARDLYGNGSAAATAIVQAWDAVGVN